MEVLARKEAQETRWECRSAQCSSATVAKSYHKRCLVEWKVPLAAAASTAEAVGVYSLAGAERGGTARELNFLCPACHSIVVTQEQAAKALKG